MRWLLENLCTPCIHIYHYEEFKIWYFSCVLPRTSWLLYLHYDLVLRETAWLELILELGLALIAPLACNGGLTQQPYRSGCWVRFIGLWLCCLLLLACSVTALANAVRCIRQVSEYRPLRGWSENACVASKGISRDEVTCTWGQQILPHQKSWTPWGPYGASSVLRIYGY
jgi:hypothetical protein